MWLYRFLKKIHNLPKKEQYKVIIPAIVAIVIFSIVNIRRNYQSLVQNPALTICITDGFSMRKSGRRIEYKYCVNGDFFVGSITERALEDMEAKGDKYLILYSELKPTIHYVIKQRGVEYEICEKITRLEAAYFIPTFWDFF